MLLIAQGEPERAREFAQLAAEQATTLQRRAHAIRLRSLAALLPDLADAASLVTILTSHDATE